ncbi:MAG: cyclase family protein [bacterium]
MFIDISMDIEDGMLHWPTDPGVAIRQFSNIKNGDSANNSEITFGTHTGTHIDAPRHFIEGGIGIDKINLDLLIGPCRVIEVNNNIKTISKDFLEPLDIIKGERLLFKTKNSLWINNKDKNFHEDYVYVSADGARYLVEKDVILVGVDYLSVEGYHIGHDTHNVLLSSNVVVIEGLNLFNVGEGKYRLIALPIKIKNSDGAPSRVLLEK